MEQLEGLLQEILNELRALRREQEPPKALLSYREFARRLGVDRDKTLKDMIHDRKIRSVKMNGRRYIPASELERLQVEGAA